MGTHIKLYETQSDYEASNPEVYTNVPVVYYVKENSKSYYDKTKKNVVLATGSTYDLVCFGDDNGNIKLRYDNGYRYTINYNFDALKRFLSTANAGATIKIYRGEYSLEPDSQGGGTLFSYGSIGPSTYYAVGKQRTVRWSTNIYFTLTIVQPYAL